MGSWFSNAMSTDGQKKFLCRLKALSQEERFCDIRIEFSDGNRKFNSLILASLSPFFEAMLSSSMKEGLTGEVSLPTVSVEVFDAVMSYYLDGEGELDEKALYEAVDACEMMELPDLKDVCILNMKENLNTDNCIRIWQLSQKYTEDQNLVRNAFMMIVKNIGIVCSQEYFLKLSLSEVLHIITSDRPTPMHENLFFDAVLKWIEANEPTETCIKELIGEISMELIRESDLLKKVYQYRDILNRHKSLNKTFEMYAVDGIQTKSLRKRTRMTSSLHKVIIVCSSSDRPILHVHAWHLGHKKWYDFSTSIPKAREQFAAGAAGSNIVISGGKANDKIISDTLIYDSFANKWGKGPDLNTARYRHASTEVSGTVYVLGGQNESFLDSIELLNANNNQWETVGNIATAVANPAVFNCGHHILVLGGFQMSSTEEESTIIQSFDTENKSTAILRNNFGRVRTGASESNTIYIISGEWNGRRDKMYCVSENVHSEIVLYKQQQEFNLPYGLYLGSRSKFVVTDGVGFIFNKSSTRQVHLCREETNKVVLPTIPGQVSDVCSVFTMFVADRSLHRASTFD